MTLPCVLNLKLNRKVLEYSEKVKTYVGLIHYTVTKALGWTERVTATFNRGFASIHILKCFALIFTLNMKVMLVKTPVLPHFNYYDSVLTDMRVKLIDTDRHQRPPNYCNRFIFNLKGLILFINFPNAYKNKHYAC